MKFSCSRSSRVEIVPLDSFVSYILHCFKCWWKLSHLFSLLFAVSSVFFFSCLIVGAGLLPRLGGCVLTFSGLLISRYEVEGRTKYQNNNPFASPPLLPSHTVNDY